MYTLVWEEYFTMLRTLGFWYSCLKFSPPDLESRCLNLQDFVCSYIDFLLPGQETSLEMAWSRIGVIQIKTEGLDAKSVRKDIKIKNTSQ